MKKIFLVAILLLSFEATAAISLESPSGNLTNTSELISELNKNTEVREQKNDEFYFKTLQTKIINRNNQRITEEVTRTIPLYLAPITTNSPEPDTVRFENYKKKMTWNVEVPANDQKTVTTSTNYLLFFGGAVIIISGLAGIKLLRKSIKIEKEVKKTKEGLKIILHIENHTNRAYREITVKDFIPSVLEEEEFKAGKPTVTKTDNGTRLEWEIERIEAGETRKLVYTIKPLFEQDSEIHIPEAELFTREGIKESSTENIQIDPDEE